MLKPLLLVVAVVAALSGCAERSNVFVSPVERTSCSNAAPLGRPLKVANYNIKSGMWTSLDEVADVLAGIDADVIALEEVDNEMGRSGRVDQSAALAERLHAERVFAGAWEKDGGTYGIALLSRVPIVTAEKFELPEAGGAEPRVGIDATVCAGDTPLRIVSAHADFLPWSAAAHAQALAERVADSASDPDGGTIVLGDLNIPPTNSSIGDFLKHGLDDVIAKFTDKPTFGDNVRIDYIFSDENANSAEIVDSDASDHRPVFATLPLVGNGG